MLDGLQTINEFTTIKEKIKTCIKKIRKSTILAEKFKDYQKISEIPEYKLVKVLNFHH